MRETGPEKASDPEADVESQGFSDLVNSVRCSLDLEAGLAEILNEEGE